VKALLLPTTGSRCLLHHTRRDRRWRAGDTHPSARVDNWNRISRPDSRRLVNLQLALALVSGESRGIKRGRGGRQGQSRGHLLRRQDLVLQRRRFGRTARKGGAIGRARVDRVQIIFGQQSRTKLHVVVQVERPSGLEPCAEGRHSRWLWLQLLHVLRATVLSMGVLRG